MGTEPAPPVGPAPLRWTAHPARRHPVRAAVAVAFVAAFSVAAGRFVLPGSTAIELVFALVLLSSLSSFLLPTRYELDEDGIRVRHLGALRRRAWRDVRRIVVGRATALVSPYPRPTRLDRFRGLVLQLDGAPPEVREALERRASALRSAHPP